MASVTGAVCNQPDQQTSESGEITRFSASGTDSVYGICLYNNTISVVTYGNAVYMYSDSGDLMKRHTVDGMEYACDVTVMTQDDGDKLIIASWYPQGIYYIPVQSAGETCTLGTVKQ